MSNRITILPLFLSLLFILGSTGPMHMYGLQSEETEIQSASGRSVHYGSWVAHREVPVDVGCDGWSGNPRMFDSSSQGNIAMYAGSCSDVVIFDVVDLLVVESIEIEEQLNFLEFSPNGDYLAVSSPYNVRIYSTSNWEIILDEDMNNFYIEDATWSGDSNRLVVATGNNGGHMYEGPDWNEVDGTTSNGVLVAHHPTEDKLWYLNSDGSGNVYEYQNVPLAGYQWVMTRSFTFAGAQEMISSPDGGELLLTGDYSTYVYSTSDYTQEETFEATGPSFSSDGSTMLLIEDDYWWNTYNIQLISTDDWTLEGEFHPENSGEYAFSSNDSEILMFSRADSAGVEQLTGYMPDSDGDGVVDYRDECPDSDTSEGSNSAGCAPSQRDTDFDGVNDRDDLCPRTKSGASTDGNGCSIAQLTDSDNDGVSDSDDGCPNTSSEGITDRKGCSSEQRDVDGDGFVDGIDECPLLVENDCSRVVFWNTTTSEIENTSQFRDIEVSADGQYIAAFDAYSNLQILDADFRFITTIPSNWESGISEIEWSPVENKLLFFRENYWYTECTYELWDGETQTVSEQFDTTQSCTEIKEGTARFSPDGKTFAFTTFSWSSFHTTTIVNDLSTHSTLLEDRNFGVEYLDFSNDGGTLIGGDGNQLVMWDTTEYEFVTSSRAQNTNVFYHTPDGNYVVTTDDETVYFYKSSNFELSNSVQLTENESEITDITFSRTGDLMYATVLVGYCFWGCEEGEGALTELHSYNLDGDELELLRSSEIISTDDIISPVYHPLEHSAYVKPSWSSNYTEWQPDSDGDGLDDAVDECPGTSLDVEVDERGCGGNQLDDDGDGFANFEDLCPDSPDGIATDENGCTDQQVDEDFDGVCNQDAPSKGPSNCSGRDQCPGSLSGIVIDSNGCGWAQQDSDGDGIVNVDDQCEDTEIAGDADENGCDRKQRDSDSDSVNDYWDDCEATPSGELIDEVGCSDSQVDSDEDSICNLDAAGSGPSNCTSIDRCPNTGVNESVDENGCSWNQRDDDGDGIMNKFDQCPGTLTETVSPNGCSEWQMDSDGDGVYDANDECANTGANQIANAKGCSDEQNELKGAGSDENLLTSNMLVWVAGVVVVVLIGFTMMRRKESDGFEEAPSIEYPQYATRGAMRDGMEWIEHPSGSQQWFYRDPSTQQWVHRE
ncbi:MAG: thrombospondin type 3 repeat-containing protein [Candidatus Thermoplasmatota archaeon]|nr:thrombospondin type 3 repeat-containing protein [Candidatus Thermoplasmatota archaeon]